MTTSYSNGTAWVTDGATRKSDRFVSNGLKWILTNPTTAETAPEVTAVADITTLPNLAMFLDARTMGGTNPANDAPVLSWTDKKNSKVFTPPADSNGNPITAAAPKYRTGTIPHLRFNGYNTRLVHGNPVLDMAGGQSIYALVRISTLGYGTIFNQGSTTSATPVYTLNCDNNGQLRYSRRTDDDKLASTSLFVTANDWKVVSVVSADYGNSALWVDEQPSIAGAVAGSAAGVATTNTTVLGCRISATTDSLGSYGVGFRGDVAALVVFNEAHAPALRKGVERRLAQEFGVTLPSGGGALEDAAAMLADRQQLSVESGVPSGMPGFHNTGPTIGTKFKIATGTFTSTADDQVVQNTYINGPIKVNHRNVTFRDCIIYSTGDPKGDTRGVPSDSQAHFERCEIFGKIDDSGTALGYTRYTADRCFVHDSEDEFRLNANVQIRDCFVHLQSNGFLTSTERLHTDCVQSNGGDNAAGVWSEVLRCTLLAIRRNLTKGNSAIILATEGASAIDATTGKQYNVGSPLRRVRIDGNYLANGSYTVYVKTPGRSGSPGPMEDIVITNNIFRGDAQFGDMAIPHATIAGAFLTMSGNVREDGTPATVLRWPANDTGN